MSHFNKNQELIKDDEGQEIPCEDDVKLVIQYAEKQKQMLSEQEVKAQPPQAPQTIDIPGDDGDSSSDEDGDHVADWVKNAAKNIVTKGNASGSGDSGSEDEGKKKIKKPVESDDEMNGVSTQPKIELTKANAGNVVYPEVVAWKDVIEPVGQIISLTQGALVVKGREGIKPMDLQSLVCLENRAVVGVIVDTFGPIRNPHYVIHLTSTQTLVDMAGSLDGLVGKDVYYVVAESTFALEEEALTNALKGLRVGNLPIEDEDTDSDGESTPCADEAWLRNNGIAF